MQKARASKPRLQFQLLFVLPKNRAAAASGASHKPVHKNTSHGQESKDRPKREVTDALIDMVLEELNSKEFDDSEEIYDENSEENSDFHNLINQIEQEKNDIFET
ncbi:hypothetical protein CRE_15763 [Caenorhabditis remanei]|uniref:Uncharacterized protein n=1 Tax=Caenorhabditis remanei TaxID=31234 RepID=E3NJR9_CAERE|nr:hypothetical protein CRE_15763 [Caenorhabditis remanei]